MAILRTMPFMLFIMGLPPLPAQQAEEQPILLKPTHTLGDQMLQISVGPIIPLFFQSLDQGVSPTGLTLGGTGSLQWNAYLGRSTRVGIDIGGMFAFSPRGNTLLMVPITGGLVYLPSLYPFEFPLSIGAGVNVVKYVDDVYLDPILKAGAGVFWQYDVSWSFGISAAYWWVPHISTREDTRFGNFLAITVSALYNF